MWVWIIGALVVVALGGSAFWPRRRGVVDRDVRLQRRRDQGRVENYNNPSGPNFGGPF